MAGVPNKQARRQVNRGARARTSSRIPRRTKATELDLRRTPMQARGQATFERILDATAELLDKVGTESLTTNLISRTADVNVATLYQYFPNKQAVLLSLFKRQNETRVEIGKQMIGGLARSPDWRRMIGDGVQAVAEARRCAGGATALRLAMRSSPDLLEHDRKQSVEIAGTLSSELVEAGVKPDKAMLIARCTIEALTAVLDLWSIDSGGKDDRVLEQAKVLVCAHLEPYFDHGVPSKGGTSGRKPARARR
ncbi:MAG TPA: TetR/AcrR family transcriptional regulator [Steroidobacteraceae bacterium]|nr:TetR/AcrR family transcriptional regulator [Steroidobacteraceae bacterium]